jgi:hypothetical protein
MIEPHVLQGGASVWFCIAANVLALGLASAGAGVGAAGAAGAEIVTLAGSALSVGSSRMFTPARNCASGERNFVAIHRKM